jgi:excinuclease ABC subunit C
MAVIGVAKKLEEIYYPGDKVPLYIDKNSEALKLIQQLRNEAHRFGIKFHRDKRSSEMTSSELDNIKGIGEKTRELLQKHYRSVEEIKSADFEELKALLGGSKARILKDHFFRSTT